jgi:hypothetical protein
MRFAMFATAVAGLALVTMLASAQAAKPEEGPITGTFVSATAGKMVMAGRDGKEQTHSVAKDAKVTIDGKSGGMDGLKKGMHVTATTDKSGSVTAIKASTDKKPTPSKAPRVKPVKRQAPHTGK